MEQSPRPVMELIQMDISINADLAVIIQPHWYLEYLQIIAHTFVVWAMLYTSLEARRFNSMSLLCSDI